MALINLDIINYLSVCSFKKTINLIRSQIGYRISVVLKRPVFVSYPTGISIEPANFCNLSCPECPVGKGTLKREAGLMTFSTYSKIIEELHPYLFNVLLYFQGEPLLHPEIIQMIEFAKSHKLYVTVSTNGQLLNDRIIKQLLSSELDRMIVSIDGTTQGVYEKYRVGGSLEKVVDETRQLIRCRNELKRNHPFIELQFLVTKFSQHQLNEIKMLGKELGVNKISYKSAQIYDFEKGNPIMPDISHYSRYKKEGSGNYVIKSKLRNRCKRMWEGAVFTSNGDVVPCCFDKDAEFPMGNINDSSFSKIMMDKRFNNFRMKIFKSRKKIKMCCNCTEGLKL